ncbi:MAG TPA: DMT family transporter [Bacteroidetes bacterium]|nr:DMT family transporter [Bacteroidota bacterium]
MSNNSKAHLYLTIVAFIFAVNYTVAKIILNGGHVGPYALTLMRVTASLILFSFFHAIFIKEKIKKKDIPLLVLCSLLGMSINQMLFIGGLKLTTHISAALITTMIPVATITASFFILKEKTTRNKLLGIVLGMAGVAILTLYGKKIVYEKSGLLGDVMIFANACFFGTFLVLVKTLMHKYHPITVMKWTSIFGFFFVLPFGFHELINTPMNDFTLHVWMAIAYVLVGTSFLAYLLNTSALKLVGPSTVSIYVYLQPAIATAIALMLGKDELTNVKIAAGLMIFSGVFLVSKK